MDLFDFVCGLAQKYVADLEEFVILQVGQLLLVVLLVLEKVVQRALLEPKGFKYSAFLSRFEVESQPEGDRRI
jgi:hypothetical protein